MQADPYRFERRRSGSGPTLGRRRFLVGAGAVGLGAAILPACGGDGDEAAADTGRYLRAAFPDGVRTAGILVAGAPVRAPLVVVDGFGPLTQDAPPSIEVTVRTADGTDVGTFTVERRGEGLSVPYYPLRFTPEAAGAYLAVATFSDLPVEFRVLPPGGTGVIQAGEPMRPVDTPTVDDDRGVTPYCTRSPDPCPFHETSLADALADRRPVALYIGTPAFCTTAVCGPILEFLLAEAPGRPDLTIVHAEVYRDPYADTAARVDTTEVISAYRLDFEPQLVVAGADGVVTAVLNNSMDRDEVAAALDTAGA
jgi:hypothetical protein